MRKALTIAALLALLAVPLFAVSADEHPAYKMDVCHKDESGSYRQLNVGVRSTSDAGGYPQGHGGHVDDSWAAQDFDDDTYDVEARGDFPGRCTPEPVACDENDSTTRVVQSVVKEPATDWVWDDGEQYFWRWLKVTTHIQAISDLDGSVCDEGDVISREKETRPKDQPGVDINVGCNDDDVGTISGTLDLGDFGVALVIEGQGSTHVIDSEGAFGPILARPGTYTWTIYGLGDNGRYVISSGEFEVDDCTPTPPPEDCSNTGDNICPGDDDPEEHPATGADPNVALAVVTALTGFALAGIGGSILFMRRRASR